MQRPDESFTSFLTRWREKLAQMKHKLTEPDQLIIAIKACIPPMANKLKDIGIRDFKELYRFRVQVKANLEYSWMITEVLMISNNILLQYFLLC